MKNLIFLLLLFTPIYTFGQKLNFISEIDIELDGLKDQILYYDAYDAEFDPNEFTKFCIVSKSDTICIDSREPFVPQELLYNFADNNVDNRLGIIREKGRIFIWLTGVQYGCCNNKTAIYEWENGQMNKTFFQDFEINLVEKCDDKIYLVGQPYPSEAYGNPEGDYYFSSFVPNEYRILSQNMRIDTTLTISRKAKYSMVEDNVDIFNAIVVHVNYSGQIYLISESFEQSLRNREYGLVSLVRLDKDYFKGFSKEELRIMRNELFAYNGYEFNSPDLKEYFNSQEWYKPLEISSESILKNLSEIEKYNIDLILEIEKTRN